MNGTAGTSAVPATRGWSAAVAGHGHAALLYASVDELLAATTPFLEEGLRAGDLVVLACPPELAGLVGGALGERAGAVETDTRICLLGTRPADAFVATRQVVERAARTPSGRVRLVGQVQFGRSPIQRREGIRYEAAANAVLAGAPMSVLCLFDTRTLPADVLDKARATHPQLVVDGDLADNRAFREPASFLRSLPVPREPLEAAPPRFAVDGATVLPQLRARLRAALAETVPDREQQEDLHLALSEVAANAFRHGRPPVSARMWSDGRRLVCTISDSGPGFDDPLAGFRPAHGEDLGRGGMGLWLARKLWDSVDLLSGRHGLTVRLSTALV